LHRDQAAGHLLHALHRTAQRDHFQAAVGVEMHVQRGGDDAVALVLDVVQLVGERARVVVVDQDQHAHGLTRLLLPLLLHELGPQHVPHELAAVGVATARRQVIERLHELLRQRDGEPGGQRLAAGGSSSLSFRPSLHRDITISAMIIPRRFASWLMTVALLVGLAGAAMAQEQPTPTPTPPPASTPPPGEPETTLAPVLVTAPPLMSSSSEQMISGRDFELRPHGRPADILRLIPGLIINQHQGGGKAEQYLIRGFDADHGTDLAIFVDNVPVNMRSHAHGQGYADLHFLIPETVRAVDVLKGPYFAEYGDFDTAGVVNFITRDFVEENTLEISGGSFNTQRYLALLSPTKDQVKTFVAIEGYHSDGPFDKPNGYLRFNLFGKASTTLAEDMKLSLWASYYHAEWHGSGEIPTRAVRSGLIDRFGSIDPNEGGITQRANVNADYRWKIDERQRLAAQAYFTYYTLTLFNDFSFFLNDPINGDMINQRDTRFLAGFNTQYDIDSQPFGMPLTSSACFQYRIDTPRVVLANAVQRFQLARTQDVSIVEQSFSPFVKFDLTPLDKVRLVAGARGDIFTFHGNQHVNTTGSDLNGDVTRARPNVKANLI